MGTVETVIEIPYAPRPLQLAIHQALESFRFAVAVCHRRFGKTVMAINHLIRSAIVCQKQRPRFAYIAPTYRQAKAIAWDYLKFYTQPLPGRDTNESELRVDLPRQSRVQLFGADNPDALRGGYFDGVVLDEVGLMASRTWTEVVRPALADRGGWALFIGTPNGKNLFWDLKNTAESEQGWKLFTFKASETGIIPPEELASMRSLMTDDEYNQELECSFEASVRGAVFANEITAAKSDGRIGAVPYETKIPVQTFWDLGVGDATAIWFAQAIGKEIRLIDYYEASGEGLHHYKAKLTEKAYAYSKHYAPHDIEVRELSSGQSRLEIASSLGIKFEVAPRLHLEDGINAARMIFNRCWFDKKKCAPGLEALQNYRRDYNTRLNEFKPTPVHDWACFTHDTEVLTRYGTCQIMNLPANGEVLTPCGWKRYEGPRITRRNAPLVAVTLSDGPTVKCTPDHLWLTESGWTSAERLIPNTVIQSCSISSRSISTEGYIGFGQASDTFLAAAINFIAPLGSGHSDLCQAGVTYTTGTRTRETTHWQTSNACQWSITVSASTPRRTNADLETLRGERPRIGTHPRREGCGIQDMPFVPLVGRSGSALTGRVTIAELFSRCLSAVLDTLRNTAPRPARRLRIVSVSPLSERADTCCIHVPEVECFSLASGAVVHNSHGADAFRYLAVSLKPDEKAKPLKYPSLGIV